MDNLFGRRAQPAPRQTPPPGYRDYPPRMPVPGRPDNQRGSEKKMTWTVVKQEDSTLPLKNIASACPADFPREQTVMLQGRYVLTIRPDSTGKVAPKQIALSSLQRMFLQFGLSDEVMIEPYDHRRGGGAIIGGLNVEIAFQSAKYFTEEPIDQDDLELHFKKNFADQILAPGVKLVMDYKAILLNANIQSSQAIYMQGEKAGAVDSPYSSTISTRGILTRDTVVNFIKAPNSPMKLKGSSKRVASNAIITPDFRFESMGIGGLDNEFAQIFRRAFASRIFPPGLVDKLGIQHVKGILLFGPPGTGKTLIARQIGKVLNAREPKVVNGPEILNKFVGQSEENIRKLFADAEKEYKEAGDESGLHIIIFDELDAICKQRGGKNDGTGVGDSVVNQLLSKMDGVDQLNNVLIIGMTNRMDMIDEALLRPGRLEVHIEISLPDEAGRRQILKIHTNRMRANNVMENDVDVAELAALTKNFSGAEINGLVKSATSFAFNRHVKVGAGVDTKEIENLKVNRADFMNALGEVRPAYGVSEEEFDQCTTGGIIPFSSNIKNVMDEGRLFVEQVRTSEKTPLVSVLLHGPPGSGKTALAASIAMRSDFPFIKLISPESMVGFNEMSKVNYLTRVFMDAYKSPLNIVVIDNIERILDWVPIGPRFSNAVLQTLLVLLRKAPPKGRRLLIIATSTERSVLNQMDMLNAFDSQVPVPNVANHEELKYVLKELNVFSPDDTQRVVQDLAESTRSTDLNVGIKKILMAVETARQDRDPAGRFSSAMSTAVIDMMGPTNY